ncbi:hypothetical protein [Paraburkholderia sp. BL18I3N2]|uniref:hypothetical protein n=1 Tax=Paraburkholderia sp. BL18I3N2 TaxID=1938799 RepID=UPI0011B20E05|nr:hypothetical protein [Paraburkholderia sp. BL18I3N2]
MAATNRWLTAADAYVARYPTKLAFCSRFRRQRETPVNAAERRFSLASGSHILAETAKQKRVSHKAQKGRRWKTASLRTAS